MWKFGMKTFLSAKHFLLARDVCCNLSQINNICATQILFRAESELGLKINKKKRYQNHDDDHQNIHFFYTGTKEKLLKNVKFLCIF